MEARVPPPTPEYLEFLSPYAPAVVELALSTRRLVLEEAPGAVELLYDAYNAVSAGYSFTGRPGEAFAHIAVYAGWVNLGFNRGSELDNPRRLLQGSGRWIRHIRIAEPRSLEQPYVRAFVQAAVARAKRPDPHAAQPDRQNRSVVRAIYPKRRRPKKEA